MRFVRTISAVSHRSISTWRVSTASCLCRGVSYAHACDPTNGPLRRWSTGMENNLYNWNRAYDLFTRPLRYSGTATDTVTEYG
eukprot:6181067-Pleurochrysis_carterae.AAC.1